MVSVVMATVLLGQARLRQKKKKKERKAKRKNKNSAIWDVHHWCNPDTNKCFLPIRSPSPFVRFSVCLHGGLFLHREIPLSLCPLSNKCLQEVAILFLPEDSCAAECIL